MATLTVYADTSDGHAYVGGTSDYNYQRSRTTGSASNSGTYITVGQLPGVYLYEGFLSFDTSSIDDGMTATSAVLALSREQDNTAQDFTHEVRAYDWGATVSSTTWRAGDTISSYPLLTSLLINPAAGYNNHPSTAEFCAAVNLSGNTQLLLVSDRLTLGIPPAAGTNEYVRWYSANQTGTTYDPKLTITYEEDITPETHNGTADITASTATSATGQKSAQGTAAITATASTSATGEATITPETHNGTAAISATSGTTASGAKATGASVSITHTADTTAQGIKQAAASASIAATTTTEAAGTAQRQGAANITATAETAATGTKSASGAAHITAATETNAVGTSDITVDKSGTAEITAISSTLASGMKSASGTATIELTSELSMLATKSANGTAEITAQTATFATGTAEIIIPTASGTAHFAATATTSASGYKTTTASADITASVTLSFSGSKSTSGTASIEAASGVTLAAFKAAYGGSEIIVVASTDANGTVNEYTATIITQTRRVTYKASHTKTTYTAKTNRSRAIWKAEG